MKRKSLLMVCVWVVLVACFCITERVSVASSRGTFNGLESSVKIPDGKVKWDLGFGKLPLYFISNEGQVDARARFYAVTPHYTLWMTENGLLFDSTFAENSSKKVNPVPGEKENGPTKVKRDVSSLDFLNANKTPGMKAVDITENKVNYYVGSNRENWKTGIRSSRAVLYTDLYKNVDLKVYGFENRVEYDWVLKQGGNPGDIRWEYKHIKSASIDSEGNLLIETSFGNLVHKKPVAYQVIDGKRNEVAVSFKKIGNTTFGFDTGVYDKRVELVIDPVVAVDFSSYFGGSELDVCSGMAVNESGEMFLTGNTYSLNFPTENAYQNGTAGDSDVFVLRLSSDGSSLIYSTYLGGSSVDTGKALTVNSHNEAYIVANSTSTNFPASNYPSGDMDVVAIILEDSGALRKASYLGGTGYDSGWACCTDSYGRFYIAGHTFSSNFPRMNSFQYYLYGY